MASAHPLTHPCPHVNTTTEDTRSFINSLFTAVALDNFGASFAAALSDSLVWTVTGSSPIAGRYEGKQVYIDEVLTPLRNVLVTLPVPIVELILVSIPPLDRRMGFMGLVDVFEPEFEVWSSWSTMLMLSLWE